MRAPRIATWYLQPIARMSGRVLMFVATCFSVTLCLATACPIISVDLLELVERHAVASLDFGDGHPQVIKLNRLIAERLAAGEEFDLVRARRHLDELNQERKEMGKTLGKGHRRMIVNAIRIRVVTAVLENKDEAPLTPTDSFPVRSHPKNSLPARSNAEVDRHEPDESLPIQSHPKKSASTRSDAYLERHELVARVRGKWEIEADSVNAIDPSIRQRLTIENIFMRDEYSDEELAQVPSEHQKAYQSAWICFTYHRNLHALEFRKMVVNAENEWQPALARRYVSIKDGKLVLVFRDDVKLLPRSLESNDENHVYYYDR